MPPPILPRQQRRKMRRDFADRGRKALSRGLPQPMTDGDAFAIAIALADTFADTCSPARASRLADAAETLLDKTMNRDTKGLAYACAKGCGWCCWQRVICTAPEIFRVAEWVRANSARPGIPTVASIPTADARNAGFIASAQPGNQRPCALLLDNACTVHPARPISCRAVLSMSAQACQKAMVEPTTADAVPIVTSGIDTAETVRLLMLAAVAAQGLDDAGYDLTEALARILPDPTAETRWLAGDAVFSGVRTAPRLPAARFAQSRLVEMIQSLQDA